MPPLVIFDCDGVLVDSEPISLAVLLSVLGGAGLVIEPARAWDKLLGRSIGALRDLVAEDFGCEIPQTLLAQMRAELYGRLERDLRAVPHVADAVAGLGTRVCVASSSLPERIALSLRVTGLAPLFGPHVFSASMVQNGKPAPDLFLHAAAQMGVAPRDCVVVEDSEAGIIAAKAAGMRVIAFIGGAHAEAAGLAAKVTQHSPAALLADMRQLRETLAALE